MSLPHEDFLYLGRHRALPLRRPLRRTSSLEFARELAGILLDRGAKLLVVACNSATAAALPALREELEQRGAAWSRSSSPSRGSPRPATANGQGRPDRHARDRQQRRLRRARSPRRRPQAELHAVASAELAPLIQEGGEVDHRTLACVEGACRPLKQAQGRHRDPRLHPLPARPSRPPARARAAAWRSSAPARRSPTRSSARCARPDLENDERRRGDYRFLATGDPEQFRRARHPLPPAADRRRSSTSRWRPAAPAGGPHEHATARATTAAPPTSCATINIITGLRRAPPPARP